MAKTPKERQAEGQPDTPHSAIESEILGEIEKAREKWGETFELKLLLGNWGDTFDDDRMLEAIRNFRRTGQYFSNVAKVADRARDEFVQADGDCSEIVVVPPSGEEFDDPKLLAEIRAGLAERFPQFEWKVETAPMRDDVAFALIPRLGSATGSGLLRDPAPEVMKAISEFLNDNFAPNRRFH